MPRGIRPRQVQIRLWTPNPTLGRVTLAMRFPLLDAGSECIVVQGNSSEATFASYRDFGDGCSILRPLSGRKSPERFLLIIADVVLDLTSIIVPPGAIVNTDIARLLLFCDIVRV